jgi:RNA polymerase sigma-70 factor, ECF subfamily
VASARPLSIAFAHGAKGDYVDVEAALETVLAEARAAFPEVLVDDGHFAEFLGSRVGVEELAGARAADLWIACASLGADPNALRAIEARYLPEINGTLGKMGLSADAIGEVKQRLRAVLFVGDGENPPRIGEYRGQGDLRAWLRVSAMRAALKLLKKNARETSSDEALLEARAGADDPELAYMKATYREAFKAAFQEALDSLQPRERTLLKQQVVDGLGIDEIGALYSVHRATAARWQQAAREKLLVRTRRIFLVRTGIATDECESIMRMVRSQLDLSLQRRFSAAYPKMPGRTLE